MNRLLGMLTFLPLAAALLTLSACGVLEIPPAATTAAERQLLLMQTPTLNATPCESCDQATLAAWQAQQQEQVNAQAAATAEILRIEAQATLESASSTLSAAQTQEQNNANIIAAHVAATAAILRAEAQATLNAANSTQSAALTQDAIRQTHVADQRSKDALAASTQTAIANLIATQTRSSVATSQWYAEQARSRNELWQNPIYWLLFCCLPLFILSIALGAFWLWLKTSQTQQHLNMQPSSVLIIQPKPNNPFPLAQAQDHARQWLEEVKRKLLTSKKDDHDNPGP